MRGRRDIGAAGPLHGEAERMGDEALLMHFMLEVIFTAELLGVNAFDQPAVEESKVLTLGYLAEMR